MTTRRGDQWKRPGRMERQYREEIARLTDEYFKLPTTAGLGEITARLVEWGQVDAVFQRYAERAASSMVTMVAAQNLKNWRTAASKASRGAEIYATLKRELHGPVGATIRAQVRANADLISSIPKKVAREATAFIAAEQQKGVRSSTLVKALRAKMPELSRSRVEVIARTEVSKAETAVTRARAQHLRMDWYEWDTSGDARVRPSHKNMDLVLVNWNDAPSPEALIKVRSDLGKYHAGEAPNCRCLSVPLVSLDEVRWPHKVYTGGRIIRMTKPQFLAIAPGYRVAA
jgi:SPP1 gp7 family putative phage head morphogenesis protein